MITLDSKQIINNLSQKETFNRKKILEITRKSNPHFSKNSVGWLLNKMTEEHLINRVGRDRYQVITGIQKKREYEYTSSYKLDEVIKRLSYDYPLMEFQAWESIQLNVFLNHQIAHNTIFVEVESMMEDSVFETLRDSFDEKVLLKPDKKTFLTYGEENTIVVSKLITESPRNKNDKHKILLEKLLVDLFANKILNQIISNSEFPNIYEDAFERYLVDESKLFRYAKRRNAEKKVKELIIAKTNIVLKVEKVNA